MAESMTSSIYFKCQTLGTVSDTGLYAIIGQHAATFKKKKSEAS